MPDDPPNGELVYGEDGYPTGEVLLWEIPPGEEVAFSARLQIGSLEHAWEIGRYTGEEQLVTFDIPPGAIVTSLQQFAVSRIYARLDRERPNAHPIEQMLEQLAVVWMHGFDQPPVLWTQQRANKLWPSGVVGVDGHPGTISSLAPDAVERWMVAHGEVAP